MPPRFALRELSLKNIYGHADAMPYAFPLNVHDELLLRSVASCGVLTPLLVQADGDQRFHIVDGHRRYLAAKHVGTKSILCIVGPSFSPGDDEAMRSEIHATILPRTVRKISLAA